MADPQRVPAAGGAGWSVVSQQETTEIDSSGQVTRGWRVYYKVGQAQGSVFVPEATYNRHTVAAKVGAAAMEVAAVSGLSG